MTKYLAAQLAGLAAAFVAADILAQYINHLFGTVLQAWQPAG